MTRNDRTAPLSPARLRPRDRRGGLQDRQIRRQGDDAVSAGAQRLSAHRPCQVDLPELRHRQRVRRQVQPPLRRHQSDEGRRRIRRVDQGGHPLARFQLGRPRVLRLGLFRAALPVGRAADPRRPGLRLQLEWRPDPRIPRHPHRAGQAQPRPRPSAPREPRSLPQNAGRRVSRRQIHAAREDRHGFAQRQHARPGPLPHPARRAPSHGGQVVHLPDVRLRPRAVRFDRRGDPLDLHARVREPPPAVRLVSRRLADLSPAANRVRPLELDLSC